MSSLAALLRLQSAAGQPAAALPWRSATAQEARHLALWAPTRQSLPADLLDRVQQRLRQAQRRYAWRHLQRSEWRLAPYLLWRGDPPLITLWGVFDRVMSHLESDRTGFMARRLIHAWLADYDDAMPRRAETAAAIRSVLASTRSAALDPWREAERRFGLFSPEGGPAGLARRVAATPGGVRQVAESANLSPSHRGFLAAFTRHALAEIGAGLASGTVVPDRLEHMLDSMGWDEGPPPASRAELARALLGPWAGGREPPEAVRRTVTEALIRHLGHPRFWHGIAPELAALMRRWRASESVAHFFALVASGRQDPEWRYRRAFWMAYANRGVLDESWLALPPDLEAPETEAHGSLAGARPKQAALLLAIGPLVFVEWSHAGRCRAYLRDDPNAPRLGQAAYDAQPLRRAGLRVIPRQILDGVTHLGAPKWLWQRHLSRFIEDRTGIAMGRDESMPD